MEADYAIYLTRCRRIYSYIIDGLPNEWNVPKIVVTEKLNQLTDEKWIYDVWNNFVECLKENLAYELPEV